MPKWTAEEIANNELLVSDGYKDRRPIRGSERGKKGDDKTNIGTSREVRLLHVAVVSYVCSLQVAYTTACEAMKQQKKKKKEETNQESNSNASRVDNLTAGRF